MIPLFLPSHGPSLELLVLEIMYFFSVLLFCLPIIFKTKQIYELTKHKGIYYFRNIFIFIVLSYFFRLTQLIILLASIIFSINIPFFFHGFNMLFFAYTGTMALFSIIMALVSKNVRETRELEFYGNLFALLISIAAFITRSPELISIIQILLVLVSVILFKKKDHFFSNIQIVYLLLLFFLILNSLVLDMAISVWLKLPIYLLSLLVFYLIFLKVNKRLSENDKKKK